MAKQRMCFMLIILGMTKTSMTLADKNSQLGDERDRFVARVYELDGAELNYRLLKPKNYDQSEKYPLVLFFHGAGERGDDNSKQLVHGMRDFASDDVMEKHPCFVIAPQCPKDIQWVDTPWTADSHTMPKEPTEPMRLSIKLVSSIRKEFAIDARRIYVTGLSMGGFGTWDAIQRHPRLFAGAVPICGGGDSRPEMIKPIAHIPVWAFHGDKDSVVKVHRSRNMIGALKDAGSSPKYTEYPGVSHNSWTATYRNREMFQWLFSQKKK